MKTKNTSHNNYQEEPLHHIPDVEIIDLDENSSLDSPDLVSSHNPQENAELDDSKKKPSRGRFLSHINVHIVLLVVTILFVAGIAYKVLTWGVIVDPNEIQPGEYDNSLDSMMPLVDSIGNTLRRDYSGNINILILGNAPFADDRDSKDNLANMIQDMTGANVYNCSITDSYLAAELPYLKEEECPQDIFNFYWLCFLAMGNETIAEKYLNGLEVMGDNAPAEAMEVYNTLTTLDLNTIDVITIMYDGSDYLASHQMYNDENPYDINQFTGNMEAGIAMLQENYPNIRIIVLSPTYAYGLDAEGNYISSDIQRYDWDVLSTYVIKQAYSASNHSVTFVDNLYGTITEDNAPEYLIDHIHLNVEGRKKVAERFVKALYYYND